MRLTTTLWTSNEPVELDNLCFVRGDTKEVVLQTGLAQPLLVAGFFRDVSRFVLSPEVLRKSRHPDVWYQFATQQAGELVFLKWFDLHLEEGVRLSHDIAFETTLIQRNGLAVPLGTFPHWVKKGRLPLHREFKLKARAYRYLANRVREQANPGRPKAKLLKL